MLDTVLGSSRGWGVLDVNYGGYHRLRAGLPARRASNAITVSGDSASIGPTAPPPHAGKRGRPSKAAAARVFDEAGQIVAARLHRAGALCFTVKPQAAAPAAMACRSGRPRELRAPHTASPRPPPTSMGLVGWSVAGGEGGSIAALQPPACMPIAITGPVINISPGSFTATPRGARLQSREEWPWQLKATRRGLGGRCIRLQARKAMASAAGRVAGGRFWEAREAFFRPHFRL